MKTRFLIISLAYLCIFFSCTTPKKEIPITPETALQRYLDNGDHTYQWEVLESYQLHEHVKAYDLKLTSQLWREFTWKHQLTIIVPDNVQYEEALLFITGGSVKNGEPNMSKNDDELTLGLANISLKNSAVTCIIRQTPNQPLYEGDLVEDQLISYTLHNFKEDGDYTWPLLFPMVKSAVKAMTAVQEFTKKELNLNVNQFVVSGASKRGWTTWLTGANDPRVTAIAPMVIDVLNMPVSLDYQVEVWKEYSIQIQDYTALEIPQQARSESGDKITKMIDPYSYRKNLTMPKMIFIGTIDEYWPVDAIKNYLDSIPGQNFIQYVPNAGHGLGDKKQTFQALSSFFSYTITKQSYPECEWDLIENASKIHLNAMATPELLVDAIVWSADSEDRDFRDEEWVGKSLNVKNIEEVKVDVDYPKSGYKAFYLDLKYTDPNGDEFVESTRMFVADDKQVFVH